MAANWTGRQLGNYRLLSLLGHGGFAEVYLGEHIYLETQAAIKVLHTQLASTDIEQFRVEARTIAHLIHPHIVRVLEFGVEGRTPYLVMDYAPNGTLRERHPKGTRLPLPTVVSYLKQIAPALQYAHEQKLIHRDIKPENLLVGRTDEILLSDFGIALVSQSSRYSSTRDMAGTIAYMAPEQIEAHPRPASDQYSLGIVVYEWLSGDRPFHGSFTEIAIKHSVVPPPPLREKVPELSPAVEQVVLTALAKDPKERFGSVKAFATAFEQASEPFIPTVFITPPSQTSSSTELITPMSETSLPPTELALPQIPSSVQSSPQQSFVATPTAISTTAKVNLIPLGFGAFALTTFVISAANAGLFFVAPTIVDLVYAIGGLVQLIAGIQEFRKGNNFAATAFCSYGAFWLFFGFYFWPGSGIITALEQQGPIIFEVSLGFFLLGWTIFTSLMFLCTLRSSKILIVVFSTLLLTFLLLTLGEFGAGTTVIGGYLGILTALLTVPLVWYTATHRSELTILTLDTTAAKTNPIPLGLSAIALTTFVTSAYNAGLFRGFPIIIGLALFYGGLVQLISGVLAFRDRSTFAAIAFCSNSGFWLAFGFIVWPPTGIIATLERAGSASSTIGVFLLSWSIFTALIFIIALRTSITLTVTFFIVFLTLLLIALGAFGLGSSFTTIGGYLGILAAFAAWYTALASLLAEMRGPFSLPVGARR